MSESLEELRKKADEAEAEFFRVLNEVISQLQQNAGQINSDLKTITEELSFRGSI